MLNSNSLFSTRLVLAGALALLSLLASGQKAENFNSKEMRQQLQSSTTQVVLTGNAATDEKIKTAFTRYWNVSKFAFVSAQQFDKMEAGKDYTSFFRFANMESKQLNITFSKVDLTIVTPKNVMYRMIEIQFDNVRNTKKEIDLGVDTKESYVQAKIIPYIMLMNSQLKKQIELGNFSYDGYRGETKQLSSKTVLVQREYFSEEIDSALVKQLPFKTRILPTEKIITTLKDQDKTTGLAQLFFIATHRHTAAFVVDLTTGDLLNYASIEKGEPDTKPLTGKTYKKLVKKLADL